MIDPYDCHPENREELSKVESRISLSLEDLKYIFEDEIKNLRERQTPLWGFSQNQIEEMFSILLKKISGYAEKKDDC